jgi:hypothetical protein
VEVGARVEHEKLVVELQAELEARHEVVRLHEAEVKAEHEKQTHEIPIVEQQTHE